MLKRKFSIFLLCVGLVITLTGCGSNISDSQASKENIKITNGTEEKNDKNSNIKIEQSAEEKKELIEMQAGYEIKKENKYVISYIKSGFSKVVNPPNMSGYYSYYKAEQDGHKYLYIIIDYKNLEEYAVDADEIGTMTVKYDNKYDYTGFPVIVDSDGDFTYANITSIAPLTTGKMYYLIDLPETVVNGSESVVATYTINSDLYKIKIR